MKPPKTISQNGYSVTVVEATALMGMRHSILQEEMAEQIKPDDDTALIYLKRIYYPALISAVGKHSGFSQWPISIEDFLELPDSFAAQWERTVWQLNPHWQPGYDPDTPQEKKELTSDSSAGNVNS